MERWAWVLLLALPQISCASVENCLISPKLSFLFYKRKNWTRLSLRCPKCTFSDFLILWVDSTELYGDLWDGLLYTHTHTHTHTHTYIYPITLSPRNSGLKGAEFFFSLTPSSLNKYLKDKLFRTSLVAQWWRGTTWEAHANAGDTSLIPCLGRSHMQLSLCATTEPVL